MRCDMHWKYTGINYTEIGGTVNLQLGADDTYLSYK